MKRAILRLTAEEFGRARINLGRVGEDSAVRIVIDLSRILAKEPKATGAITVERPDGKLYPAVTNLDGTCLVWDVADTDVAVEGTGRMQLTVFGSEGEKLKSAVAPTRIGVSLTSGVTLDPVQNWIDDATNKLGAVVQAGEAAETAASKANAAAEAANTSAQKAEDAADAATTAAGKAETAAEKAETAAGKADTATTSANTAAKKAEDAATTATTAAGTANTAAGNASAAAATAATAAKAAQDVADTVQTKLDNGDLTGPKGEPGSDGLSAPQIDDTAVTATNPWSSKQIVDTLCQPINVTGNPVQCYPVEGYPLGVTASWEPAQAGSGDPSPENIRPITGKRSVTITRQEDSQSKVLALPETVYGGSLQADGAGEKTWVSLVLTGAENWKMHVSGNYIVDETYNRTKPKLNGDYPTSGLCSHFLYNVQFGEDNILLDANVFIFLGRKLTNKYTIDTWKNYLAEQYAAGTPVTIAYEVASPALFTATGGGTIPAISGVNTLLTDADTLTVKGREDPNHTISALATRIAALETAAANE